MPGRFKLRRLLQGLFLLLLAPAYEASSLGLTVHVVPLDSDGGNTVRAHFSVVAPSPCPDFSSVCGVGEDCLAHTTSLPFTGTKPSPAWCVRQWQKTVPSNYSDVLTLGSSTQFYVSINATPKIRTNSGKLNNPAFVALPPPLRARVNCPHHFQLSVKDLDGDRVQCRFAQADKGECRNCTRHSFIELDEKKCTVAFTGDASPGQYFIYLMAEDVIPAPRANKVLENSPLSSVPVHLSLRVEESSSSCSEEPVATEQTPEQNSVLFVLPFEEVKFSISYNSALESVSEVAVVGPPELYRTGLTSVGTLVTLNVAWIRSENNLTRLLPICFVANTNSLQSELQCVWLYQREMRTLPAGTELRCEKAEMTLVLPVASLTDINLDELQLNSPTCPLTHNSTHLTARISLNGCGTKTVHAGSELVYTNTLQSVRPYTMVSRQPSLVLPLACRIPKAEVKGPQYAIGMPSDDETFGTIRVWMEVHLPGEGPLARFTSNAKLRSNYLQPERVRREVEGGTSSNNSTSTDNESAHMEIGSKIKQLDLHLMSNCSVDRAEMVVSNCIESETEDFAESHPIMDEGCMMSNNTFEVVTSKTNSRVYRLNIDTMATTGSMMYIQCTVKLCIATMPSEKCPDLCTKSRQQRVLIDSIFTSTYTLRSEPVSLVVTTPAPKTTPSTTTTTTIAPVAATQCTTASHAPEVATTSMAAGVILTTICILLQNFILY